MTEDRDDGASSLAVRAVTHGYVVMFSPEITCRRGMPDWSKRKRFLWLNQCHLHMQDETNPHRREVLHLRPSFLSFSSKPSLIKWSPDNAHLSGEQSVPSHCVQREGIWEKVWTQDDSMQRKEAQNRLRWIEECGGGVNCSAVKLYCLFTSGVTGSRWITMRSKSAGAQ